MKYSWVTVNPETSKPTTLSALESIIAFGAQTEWYADARAELDALRIDHDAEVTEFNAGYEAYGAGIPIENEPRDTKYDQWRVGWAWAAFKPTQIQLKTAQKDADDWKRECEMYRNAWLREIGGQVIPKTHMIDALVLTTREIYAGYRAWLATQKEN